MTVKGWKQVLINGEWKQIGADRSYKTMFIIAAEHQIFLQWFHEFCKRDILLRAHMQSWCLKIGTVLYLKIVTLQAFGVAWFFQQFIYWSIDGTPFPGVSQQFTV